MAISYTNRHNFPLLDDGSGNAGAVNNGVLEDLDRLFQEGVIGLLGKATVNMQNGDGKSIAYTVPAGKKAMVVLCAISEPTASLADGNDFDTGAGANADDWKQTIDLSALVGTNDYYIISNFDTMIGQIYVAADEFGIKPATGATADADATMWVFGVEWDA